MKILLLEDDLDLCDLIQKELSKSGHTVDCCNDGGNSHALRTQ